MNMQSPTTGEEIDYIRRGNASRPTVIYFHGLLNKEASKEDKEPASNLFFKENSQLENCVKISAAELDYGSEDEEQKDDTSDVQCLESDEYCLPKRHRTAFTSFQLKRLQEEFDRDAYIIGMKRWRLSEELEIPEKQIKIWFQNRRTKLKKHCTNYSGDSSTERRQRGQLL